MKKITQIEADQAAADNEEFLHSHEYQQGDYDAEFGKQADFSDTDLSGLKFTEKFLDHVNFTNAKLHGTEFLYCTLEAATFLKSDLEDAVFVECFLDRAYFESANCKNVRFIDCRIRDAHFRNADLRETILGGSDLEGSDMGNVQVAHRADPDKYKNVTMAGIRNNEYVKRWLDRQAYLAEFESYHPVVAWFWKWGSDYGRSAWVLMAWYVAAILFFGSIYSFTDLFYFDHFSWLSGYIQAALMMIPFGYARVLPYGLVGQVLLLSQAMLAYLLLILIGVMLLNKLKN